MLVQRQRAFLYAGLAIAIIWALALAGYYIAKRSKMTVEKVRVYAESVDLSKLSAGDRAKAIQKLADKLNSLPYEERQRAQFDRLGTRWFDGMTDKEKGQFVEATLPTGMKQMLNAFEALPTDKRQRAVNDAIRNLQRDQARMRETSGRPPDPNAPPPISDDLRQRIVSIGLTAFYNQSSAQTKAEIAPLLEELQRAMESGRMLRGPGRPPGP